MKKRILLLLCSVLMACAVTDNTPPVPFNSKWFDIDPTGYFRGHNGGAERSAVFVNGTPYLYTAEYSIYYYKNGLWNQLPKFPSVKASIYTLHMKSFGNYLYVGYAHVREDTRGDKKSYIERWDGRSWEIIGGSSVTSEERSLREFVIQEDGVIYATIFDIKTLQMSVVQWNGVSWADMGAPLEGNESRLLLHGGELYWLVSRRDYSPNNDHMTVMRWTGAVWEPVGASFGPQKGLSSSLYTVDLYWFAGALQVNYLNLIQTPNGGAYDVAVVYRYINGAWEAAKDLIPPIFTGKETVAANTFNMIVYKDELYYVAEYFSSRSPVEVVVGRAIKHKNGEFSWFNRSDIYQHFPLHTTYPVLAVDGDIALLMYYDRNFGGVRVLQRNKYLF